LRAIDVSHAARKVAVGYPDGGFADSDEVHVTRDDVRTLVDYHYWARNRMFEALANLTSDQFTQNLFNSFPSIRDTVVHLYAADRGWHLLWEGQPLTEPLRQTAFQTSRPFGASGRIRSAKCGPSSKISRREI
jgi:DinB family